MGSFHPLPFLQGEEVVDFILRLYICHLRILAYLGGHLLVSFLDIDLLLALGRWLALLDVNDVDLDILREVRRDGGQRSEDVRGG